MPSSACKKSALRSEEHTSELQSHDNLGCRFLLEKKKTILLGNGPFPFGIPGSVENYKLHVSQNFWTTIFHFFFFNDTATTEIYTLSLHDALPIQKQDQAGRHHGPDIDHLLRHVGVRRSEEHTSELQSHDNLVCRLLLEQKKV